MCVCVCIYKYIYMSKKSYVSYHSCLTIWKFCNIVLNKCDSDK